MTVQSELAETTASIVTTYGEPIKIDLQTTTFNANDYDVASFAKSGTTITGSALFFPVSDTDNGDRKFLADGLITLQDKKVFIYSGISITQEADVVIAGGSFNPIQIIPWSLQGSNVYTKIFLRSKLP